MRAPTPAAPTAPGTSARAARLSRRARLERLDRLLRLLDTAILIPGTGVRFGADAVIVLVPGIGDAATTALSSACPQPGQALPC